MSNLRRTSRRRRRWPVLELFMLLAGLIFAALMGAVGGFLPALHAARQPLAASLRGM